MKNKILFLLMFFPVVALAQRELQGQLVANDFPVSGVYILNEASGESVISSESGGFKIFANDGDFLIVGGLSFKSVRVAVTEVHFTTGIEVRLQPEMYVLEEIVVPRYKLTGDLQYDSRHIPVRKDTLASLTAMIKDAAKRSTKEYPSGSRINNIEGVPSMLAPNGINLLGAASLVTGLFKTEPKPPGRYDGVSFSEAVTRKYPPEFFTETLKLKPSEALDFINFCDASNPDMSLFDKGRELELLEYILKLHREYVNK